MAYKSRKERKRASGGKAGGHLYNAEGAPESKEIDEKDEGFKRGGSHHKRAHGGHVDGEHGKHHLGKRARGGHMPHCEKEEHRARGGHVGRHGHAGKGSHHAVHHGHGMLKGRARGGSPFSAAHATSMGVGTKAGSPGEQAPSSD